jgi:hypothetical protein
MLSKRQNFLEPQFTDQTERAIPANAKNWSANAMGINARRSRTGRCGSCHQLDAGEYDASGSARFQVEHRAGHRLDGAMILLKDVLEELNLHHKERHVAAGVDCIHGRVVGSAFVHRDFVWIAVRSDCLVEEALRCGHVALVRQQEVEGLRCLSMKSCRFSC